MDMKKYKEAVVIRERIAKINSYIRAVRGNNDLHTSARADMYSEVGLEGLLKDKRDKLEEQFNQM